MVRQLEKPMKTAEERGRVPPLDDILDKSPLQDGMGIGINEHIVHAGYHPTDYGRNLFRSFGGMYPPKQSREWRTWFAPSAAIMRKHSSEWLRS